MICSLSLLLLEAPKEEVTQSSRTSTKTHGDDAVNGSALRGSHLDYTILRANNTHALKSTAFCSKLEKEKAILQLLVFRQ
jgi:hypothetical protein